MKKLILVLLFISQLFGTTYYVSTSGSDSNNGTTSSTPWKTLAKLYIVGMSTEFGAGDSILLKCGDTWDEILYLYGTGTNGNNVVYSSYGTGTNPEIKMLTHRNYHHANVDGNNEYITIENMRIKNNSGRGIDTRTINHMIFKNLYIYDCSSHGIDISDELTGMTDWLIQDVEINNSGAAGVWSSSEYSNFTFLRLITHNNTADGATFRHGNNNQAIDCISYSNTQDGFDVGGSVSGATFEFYRCISHNNISAGFSLKYGHADETTKISMYFCLAHHNYNGIEIAGNLQTEIINCTTFNNKNGCGLYSEATSPMVIKNSIFDKEFKGFNYLSTGATLSSDYNNVNADYLFYVRATSSWYSLVEIQAYAGGIYEQNSISVYSEFADTTNYDFRFNSSSLCLSAGDTSAIHGVANLYDLDSNQITDADGNMIRDYVNIGAYDYSSILTINNQSGTVGDTLDIPILINYLSSADNVKVYSFELEHDENIEIIDYDLTGALTNTSFRMNFYWTQDTKYSFGSYGINKLLTSVQDTLMSIKAVLLESGTCDLNLTTKFNNSALSISNNAGTIIIEEPDAVGVFQSTTINQPTSLVSVLKNIGGLPLIISTVYSDNDVFTVKDSVYTIQAGDSTIVDLTFESSEVGTFKGNIWIESNDPDNPKANIFCTGIVM